MGFPFAPSDMVLRRDWAFRVNLFDESYIHFSEDLDINCRLALAGCQFASVDQVFNYRRYYPGRIIKNVRDRFDAACRALDVAFNHQGCSDEVRDKRPLAFSVTHLVWSYEAFILQDTPLAHELISEAIRLNPALIDDNGRSLLEFLVSRSIQNGSDHEPLLDRLFAQLPTSLAWLTPYRKNVIAAGYLRRSVRSVLAGQPDEASHHLAKAVALGMEYSDASIQYITYQLLNFEFARDEATAETAAHTLATLLGESGGKIEAQQFRASYQLTRAFAAYEAGRYEYVPLAIIQAIKLNPRHLTNRGVLSILTRSLFATNRQNVAALAAPKTL